MKKSEIIVGETYVAKVSNQLTVVRLNSIQKTEARPPYSKSRTHYACVNLKTGREVGFRSAASFRRKATQGTIDIYCGKKEVPRMKKQRHVRIYIDIAHDLDAEDPLAIPLACICHHIKDGKSEFADGNFRYRIIERDIESKIDDKLSAT